MKSIIDAFGLYVVEACLFAKLTDIFTPTSIFGLDDTTISRVAAESEEALAERDELTKKLKVLEQTMKTMQRLRTLSSAGKSSRL